MVFPNFIRVLCVFLRSLLVHLSQISTASTLNTNLQDCEVSSHQLAGGGLARKVMTHNVPNPLRVFLCSNCIVDVDRNLLVEPQGSSQVHSNHFSIARNLPQPFSLCFGFSYQSIL